MEYKEIYEKWLKSSAIDEKTKQELREICCDEEEIKDRFCRDLEFGTSGLRGVMAAGTNRMNKYTVGKATAGLAKYINRNYEKGKSSVVIAYDSRHNSLMFAETAGSVLAANGIKTYIFETLRPTPELSFAIRELNATAGIVITASHNPSEYNGYKVYFSDGGQITSPVDKDIIYDANTVKFSDIKFSDIEKAKKEGLYEIIGKEIDEKYYKNILSQIINKDFVKENGKNLSVVYTPLYGTGNVPVRHVLKEAGFTDVSIVKEQENPNGDFPTTPYPNPEEKSAFKLAVELAKEKQADIIIANDPDCDRVGVSVRDKSGEYFYLSGNDVGVLLTEYILSQKNKKNILPENGVVIKSIVSTDMVKPICKEYGIETEEILTGFKYIGEKIKEYEQTKEKEYVFGFEESYGYLSGTYARDKDGVVAAALVCEAALYLKEQGKTLIDKLNELYEKYGYYKEKTTSFYFRGPEGSEKMAGIMKSLRENVKDSLCGKKIVKIKDYKTQVFSDLLNNTKEKSPLPVSNVLQYVFADDSTLIVRPSGTEPKIKFYIFVSGKTSEESENKIKEMKNYLEDLLK